MVPSALVTMVPLAPVATAKLAESAMPCRSLVVGTVMAYHKTPKALLTMLVMPLALVTQLVVARFGLMMRLPALPTVTSRLLLPPTPRKMELVTASGTSSSFQSEPLALVSNAARSPTAT